MEKTMSPTTSAEFPGLFSIRGASGDTVGHWLEGSELMEHWVAEAKSVASDLEHDLARHDLCTMADDIRRLIELADWMQAQSRANLAAARAAQARAAFRENI